MSDAPIDRRYEDAAEHFEVLARMDRAEARVRELEAEAVTADRELASVNAQVNGLAARLEAFKSLHAVILRLGEWDEGCFYFQGTACPELQRPLNRLDAAGLVKGPSGDLTEAEVKEILAARPSARRAIGRTEGE